MSGIPRPVTDLPDRAISVRLIRGDLSKNIANSPVHLHVGSKIRTVKTDESGRAQFDGVEVGAPVRAVAVVDGERLESQEFPAPAQGGIRLLLVATDKEEAAAGGQPLASTPVPGQVVMAGNTRLVMEPGEESVQVYYLLDLVNKASTPVNPPAPLVFEVPAEAGGAAILEGSSPQAALSGKRVTIGGPFAPGSTSVQLAYEIPAPTGSLEVAQRFPVSFEQLAVIVKKVGSTSVRSRQITRQQEAPAGGEVYIWGTGGTIAANQPIEIALDGMPHHSPVPRWIALSLAVVIVAVGVWASARPEDRAGLAAERKRLVARREKLLGDLVRLEVDRREGRTDGLRYDARREEIVAALEHIYGALDTDDLGPEPTSRAA